MKKLLLLMGLGLATLGSASASDYDVYRNGVLSGGLRVDGWWNDAVNFQASNPDGNDGEVFSFKPADGGTDASMGLYLLSPQNTGKLHSATLNFDWYAEGTGTYTVRLKSINEENYEFTVTAEEAGKWNTTSLNVAEEFPTVSQQWKEDKNLGEGYVFGIVVTKASNAVIYFDNIYYSNIDDSWEAPEHQEVAPESVPIPQHPAEDVTSIFSSVYNQATEFNIGGWGQTTGVTDKEIDGQKVYKLTNFNYLGWEFTNHINVSDYNYMHVDFWTAEETPFGFTPISPGPHENVIPVSEVRLNEWNSYDMPLSEWENVDLSDLFQIKFDKGAGVECFIANVYFWKEEGKDNPGEDNPGQDQPSNTGTVKDTITNCWLVGTTNSERINIDVELSYTISYNADKTLTITMIPDDNFYKVVGMVPKIDIGNGKGIVDMNKTDNSYSYTTSTDSPYKVGDTVNMYFYCAYDGGATTFPNIIYVVSESSEDPEPDDVDFKLVVYSEKITTDQRSATIPYSIVYPGDMEYNELDIQITCQPNSYNYTYDDYIITISDLNPGQSYEVTLTATANIDEKEYSYSETVNFETKPDMELVNAEYTGFIKGSYTQGASEFEYKLKLKFAYNNNKTVSVTGGYEWPNGAPEGNVNQFNVLFKGENLKESTQGGTVTSTETYENGKEIEITFNSAVAGGDVSRTFTYIVGSTNGFIHNHDDIDKTEQSGEFVGEIYVLTLTQEGKKQTGFIYIDAPKYKDAPKDSQVQVYYKKESSKSAVKAMAEAENNGFQEADTYNGYRGAAVELGEEGTLTFYHTIGDFTSDPVSYQYKVIPGIPTAVETIEAVEGEAEYFTLQGVKVNNPEKGIYIKVVNGKATKVVL